MEELLLQEELSLQLGFAETILWFSLDVLFVFSWEKLIQKVDSQIFMLGLEPIAYGVPKYLWKGEKPSVCRSLPELRRNHILSTHRDWS